MEGKFFELFTKCQNLKVLTIKLKEKRMNIYQNVVPLHSIIIKVKPKERVEC